MEGPGDGWVNLKGSNNEDEKDDKYRACSWGDNVAMGNDNNSLLGNDNNNDSVSKDDNNNAMDHDSTTSTSHGKRRCGRQQTHR